MGRRSNAVAVEHAARIYGWRVHYIYDKYAIVHRDREWSRAVTVVPKGCRLMVNAEARGSRTTGKEAVEFIRQFPGEFTDEEDAA